MKKTLIILAAGLLASTLVSCGPKPKNPSAPIFGIHYYPYTVAFVRTAATPTPDFKDWTEERMLRDLERIGKTGTDVIIVSVNPEEIVHQNKGPSYLKFIELAGKNPDGPKVMFMAECHGSPKEDIHGFLDWCAEQKFAEKSGYFQWEGKPIVQLYDALADKEAGHDELTVRHTVWSQEWYWGVAKSPETTELSKNGEQAMVFAGFLRNRDQGIVDGWDLERANGQTLRDRIRAAIALKPKIVCVASWNDFWEGHFIEPNSLDGNRLSEVLTEEIAEAKTAP